MEIISRSGGDGLMDTEVKVEPQEYQPIEREIFKKYKNQFKVPGFRVGRAPLQVIKARYGKDIFVEDMTEEFVNHALTRISEKNVFLTPSLKEEVQIEEANIDEENNLVIKLKFKTQIGFELTEEPITLDEEDFNLEVSDEDVEEELEKQRQENVFYLPLEGPPQEDDRVVLDFHTYVDKGDFTEVLDSANNFAFYLGNEFGMFVDEDYQTDLDSLIGKEEIPETLHIEREEDGETIITDYVIHQIDRPVTLELDDDFAQSILPEEVVGEMDLEAYKKFTKEMLEHEKAIVSKRKVTESIVKQLLDNSELILEDGFIDTFITDCSDIDEAKRMLFSFGPYAPPISERQLLELLSMSSLDEDEEYDEDDELMEEVMEETEAYLKYYELFETLNRELNPANTNIPLDYFDLLVQNAVTERHLEADPDLLFEINPDEKQQLLSDLNQNNATTDILYNNVKKAFDEGQREISINQLLGRIQD